MQRAVRIIFFAAINTKFIIILSAPCLTQTAIGPNVDLYKRYVIVGSLKFTRFEIGVSGTMGYVFPSDFMFSTNYSTGLNNIYIKDPGTQQFLGFGMGYIFDGAAKPANKNNFNLVLYERGIYHLLFFIYIMQVMINVKQCFFKYSRLFGISFVNAYPIKHFIMKKIFFVATILGLVSISATAQTTSFGIKGSLTNNFFSSKTKSGGNWTRQVASGAGFNAGLVADIGFTDNFSIQPQLLFADKAVQPSTAMKVTLLTLDLPINFVYKMNGFQVGIGPNLSYGLSAKSKNDGQPDQNLYDNSGVNNGQLNRFEFGANAMIGYQWASGLTLAANYTPGLSDLNNQNSSGSNTRYNTRIYGVSLGYMFNSMKPMSSGKKK